MPGGGEKSAYVEFLTTRGYLRSRTGNRSLQAGQTEVNSSHELTCRLFEGIENELSKDLKIVIDNRFFTITDWQKVDEKRFYYTFQLTERK